MPAENLIGEEGQGFEIAMHSLDQGRFTVAAGACGVVRACLERSVEYARERETFGQAIGKYQFVQDMIAKMVLGYETSKLLVMQAAWMKNEGKRNTRETSLAKWHATESAFEAAHLAIQVFGSYGYSAEYGIERYFRNARAPIIYEGTTQIHKMMQAEHALGYRRLNGRERRRVAALLVGAGAVAGSRQRLRSSRSGDRTGSRSRTTVAKTSKGASSTSAIRRARGLRFAKHGRIHDHAGPNDTIVSCLEGEGFTSVDGERAPIRSGERVFWPAGDVHGLWTEGSTMTTLMCELPLAGGRVLG